VTGDLAGFVSGVYLRGTPFIQIPTTLIAQVDSSIGGKTGVNHPLGKNLIGVFHQPRFVWIDTDLVQTLKDRDFISGLAEVVKYGMIYDAAFFNFMEANHDLIRHRDPGVLFQLVKRSCEIKAEVVGKDEKESGLRKILNYGHTLGHAVEAVTAYKKYRHGEAISIGMDFAARLSEKELGLPKDIVNRQKRLLESLGLPWRLPKLRLSELMGSMLLDKKVSSGKIYFILPEKIGRVRIEPVSRKKIENEIRRSLSGKAL
ncbi:MAG TPA: 3-dehydroquinate synthase, partial [Nitrospiria bacterium]|nr:3-dehydroquinate synthase [Nitrospiria bacterium]